MLVKKIDEVRNIINQWKKEGYSVGYVPTMGALHQGHASLIEKAACENDKVIVSVFVNPTQFGPNEDYSTYPRNIEKDLETAAQAGADIVFNPEAGEMYYTNKSTTVTVGGLTDKLCGAKRPGHFDGVCLVVAKFFNIILPDNAYFGQKDAQQVAVIKRMVRDLNFNITIKVCEIVREEDGLAKSSRNSYLSDEERNAAVILYKSLMLGKTELENGLRNAESIKNIIKNRIETEKLSKIDYVEIVDAETLEQVSEIKSSVLIMLAVYIGKTRLIDNLLFEI